MFWFFCLASQFQSSSLASLTTRSDVLGGGGIIDDKVSVLVAWAATLVPGPGPTGAASERWAPKVKKNTYGCPHSCFLINPNRWPLEHYRHLKHNLGYYFGSGANDRWQYWSTVLTTDRDRNIYRRPTSYKTSSTASLAVTWLQNSCGLFIFSPFPSQPGQLFSCASLIDPNEAYLSKGQSEESAAKHRIPERRIANV